MTKSKICLLSTLVLAITLTSCSTEVPQSSYDVNVSSNNETLNQNESPTEDCVITIAVTSGSMGFYEEKIKEFNSENNGYKIECKNYDEFYDSSKDLDGGATLESFAEIDNQIVLDVIKGENIDIITDLVFTDTGKYNELVKKGAFTDLYTFLDSDDELSRKSFFENILELSEFDGKLATIPLFFSVDTVYGETQYVGKKENWTLDEMIERWESMPEEATFNGKVTKDSVFREILRPNITSFVDIEKGVCNFNSPEFLKELKFINSFPSPETYKTEPNYYVPNFLTQLDIRSFQDYHDLFFNVFNEKIECTLVGYPSSDGCGAFINPIYRFGISSNSTPEKQKGAWMFIRKLLEYDYQYEWGKYFFPINYEAFSQGGKDVYSRSDEEYTFTAQGEEYTGTFLNYDEYCSFFNYIKNIQKMNIDINDSITNVIEEEIHAMIYDEKSPEDVTEIIQNRVEILVSEKY